MSSAAFPYDTLGPIEGYRVWRMDDDRLFSFSRDAPWPVQRPMVARCLGDGEDRRAPHPSCRCGIYAARDLGLLCPTIAMGTLRDWGMVFGGAIVVGTARLWGRVYEHERGWRSELAYPTAIFSLPVSAQTAPRIERLLEAYAIVLRPAPPALARLCGPTSADGPLS